MTDTPRKPISNMRAPRPPSYGPSTPLIPKSVLGDGGGVPVGYVPPGAPDARGSGSSDFEKGFSGTFAGVLYLAGALALLIGGFFIWLWGFAIAAAGVTFWSVFAGALAATRNFFMALIFAVFGSVSVFTMILSAPVMVVSEGVQLVGALNDDAEHARYVQMTNTGQSLIITNTHPQKRARVGRVVCDGRWRPVWRDDMWEHTEFSQAVNRYLQPGESHTIPFNRERTIQLGRCTANRW